MPKFSYEAGEEDELDSPEMYQPIKSRKLVRGGGKQAGLHARGINPPKVPPPKQNKIHVAKRMVTAMQRRAFNAVTTEAITSIEPSVADIDLVRLYAAVLTTSRSRTIFRQHFAPGQKKPRAVAGFNQAVTTYLKQTNDTHPTISSELGELDILGGTDPEAAGICLIGIRLRGAGRGELRDGTSGLIAALSAAELCSPPIEQHRYYSDPYLGLARTKSPETAGIVLAAFRREGVVEAVRASLVNSDNPEGLVTFGPAIPEPYPV